MIVLVIIGIYLGLGIMALGLLDFLTKRIRNRLSTASSEARDRMAVQGTYVGARESTVLVIGAMWLFWPLVVLSVFYRS